MEIRQDAIPSQAGLKTTVDGADGPRTCAGGYERREKANGGKLPCFQRASFDHPPWQGPSNERFSNGVSILRRNREAVMGCFGNHFDWPWHDLLRPLGDRSSKTLPKNGDCPAKMISIKQGICAVKNEISISFAKISGFDASMASIGTERLEPLGGRWHRDAEHIGDLPKMCL